MIELDPGAVAGAAMIVASVGVGLLGRRGIAVLDAKRDARLARREAQRPAAVVRQLPAGARR
jgi:hypothetical protein